MKLAGEQLVLDTNILVHLLRSKDAGQAIEHEYQVGQRAPRALVPIVVKGELKALGLKFNWNAANHQRIDEMMAALPTVDISHPKIISSYAQLDFFSHGQGIRMGKNDIWIAATTQVVGGVLLTTDGDFDHLDPSRIRVERLDVEQLRVGKVVAAK